MSRNESSRTGTSVIRILVLLVLAITVLIILLNAERIRDTEFFRMLFGNDLEGEPTTSFSYSPDSANAFAVYRGGLSVIGSTGLSVLDKTGDESLAISASLAKPVIKAAGRHLICYGVGGSRLLYVRDNKLVENILSDAPILTAEVNDEGWTLTVSEKLGSKATCLIYNDKLELVYEWISSERYINCSALSDDCKSAVIGGLQQRDASVVSAVVFIRFDSETPYAEIEFNNVVVLDVEFLKDGSVAVLTENSIAVFDEDGTKRGSYEFDSELLHEYDFDGDGFILLRLARSNSNEISDVYVLNYECEVEQSIAYSNIMEIDAEDNYFGILTNNMVVVYNDTLEKQFTSGISTGSKSLLVNEGGAAYVLSTVEATIYR